MKRVTRRELLRLSALAAGGSVLAACGATPTPQVVKEVVTQAVENVGTTTPSASTPTAAPAQEVTLSFYLGFGAGKIAAVNV